MQQILSELRRFLKERGWENLLPSDVAKSVAIEASELLEIFQWVNLSIEETKSDPVRMEQLKHEVADVLIYTLYLPLMLDLDPVQLIRDKLKLNAIKYPATKLNDTSQ